MSDYPHGRPAYFSQRYIRLLTKTAAAQGIGATAAYLCTVVAAQEHAKKYKGPVNYYNGQLQPLIGASKVDTLAKARRSAVDHGWLHYEPPQQGERKPGLYWVTIPAEYEDLHDGACDESAEEFDQPSPRSLPEKGVLKTGNEAGNTTRKTGIEAGIEAGNFLKNSNKKEERAQNGEEDSQGGGKKPKRQKRPLKFTQADTDTAAWIRDTLTAINPELTPPKLDQWANDVRLLRERDQRADERIREVFAWASADKFWQSKVLEPAKLRKHWATITTQMLRGKPAEPSAPSSITTADLIQRQVAGGRRVVGDDE